VFIPPTIKNNEKGNKNYSILILMKGVSTSYDLLHDAGFIRKVFEFLLYSRSGRRWNILSPSFRFASAGKDMWICRWRNETDGYSPLQTQLIVGAAKLELPSLSPSDLWKKSGRFLTTGDEVVASFVMLS
jgi:hypothetical protein